MLRQKQPVVGSLDRLEVSTVRPGLVSGKRDPERLSRP